MNTRWFNGPILHEKILLLTDLSEVSRNAFQVARSFFSDTLVDFTL